MSPVPQHVIKKYGRQWSREEHIVVNGPFTMVSRQINVQITLKRNTQYWNNEKTVLNQVVFYPLESEMTALNRYRTGGVDLVTTVPTLLYDKLMKEMPDQLTSSPALATYYLTFQTKRPPFDDARVRKALSYVIDRERIAHSAVGQGVMPAYTFTPESISGFIPPQPVYEQESKAERLAKAKALMNAAGYSSRKPLVFTYLYNATDVNRSIAVALQQMWQSELPVKVSLESMEWIAYLQNKLDGKYQAARALWGGDYNDAMTMLDVHTPQHANNSSFYNSARFNRLLSQAKTTADNKKRNALYAEAELVLTEDMPVAPIYWDSRTYLIKPDLRGVYSKNPQGILYSKAMYKIEALPSRRE